MTHEPETAQLILAGAPFHHLDYPQIAMELAMIAHEGQVDKAGEPIINHVAMRRNTMQIALSGNASERALRSYGEKIRDGLLTLPKVTQVDLSSVRGYEISIEVSEQTLREYSLTSCCLAS